MSESAVFAGRADAALVAASELSSSTRRELGVVVAKKRRRHPELRMPTMAGVRRVLRREGVVLVADAGACDGRLAYAFAIDGVACIALTPALPRRVGLFVLLHELAHVWLHVHAAPKAQLAARSRAFLEVEARCEAEANYVARLLIGRQGAR